MRLLSFLMIILFGVTLGFSQTTITRYVVTDCAFNGDGTSNTCAVSDGAAGAYKSGVLFESSAQTDLVANDQVMIVKFSGTTADPGNFSIDGWRMDATRYLRLTCDDGTVTGCNPTKIWSNSYFRFYGGSSIDNVISINADSSYVYIDNLQIGRDFRNSTSKIGIIFATSMVSGSRVYIHSNIMKGNGANGGATGTFSGYRPEDSDLNSYFYNNIVYDISSPGGRGLSVGASGADIWAYNNTFHNVGYGIEGNSVTTAKNNIVQTCVTSCYGGSFNGASNYNLSEDATTTGGANDKASTSVTFIDEAGDNFHLDAVDVGALDAGTDLSADVSLSFSNDIDGDSRSGTWDIGADENLGTSGAIYPPYDLVASRVSSGSIGVICSDSSTTTKDFIFERKLGVGGTYVAIDTVAACALTDEGLTPNSVYYYRALTRDVTQDTLSAYSNEDSANTNWRNLTYGPGCTYDSLGMAAAAAQHGDTITSCGVGRRDTIVATVNFSALDGIKLFKESGQSRDTLFHGVAGISNMIAVGDSMKIQGFDFSFVDTVPVNAKELLYFNTHSDVKIRDFRVLPNGSGDNKRFLHFDPGEIPYSTRDTLINGRIDSVRFNNLERNTYLYIDSVRMVDVIAGTAMYRGTTIKNSQFKMSSEITIRGPDILLQSSRFTHNGGASEMITGDDFLSNNGERPVNFQMIDCILDSAEHIPLMTDGMDSALVEGNLWAATGGEWAIDNHNDEVGDSTVGFVAINNTFFELSILEFGSGSQGNSQDIIVRRSIVTGLGNSNGTKSDNEKVDSSWYSNASPTFTSIADTTYSNLGVTIDTILPYGFLRNRSGVGHMPDGSFAGGRGYMTQVLARTGAGDSSRWIVQLNPKTWFLDPIHKDSAKLWLETSTDQVSWTKVDSTSGNIRAGVTDTLRITGLDAGQTYTRVVALNVPHGSTDTTDVLSFTASSGGSNWWENRLRYFQWWRR